MSANDCFDCWIGEVLELLEHLVENEHRVDEEFRARAEELVEAYDEIPGDEDDDDPDDGERASVVEDVLPTVARLNRAS